MNCNLETIELDGVKYVKAENANIQAQSLDGMEYCIVRTYSAGVFAGYIKERNGKETVLLQSRQLWAWSGACGLSQLAVDGTKSPESCKFTVTMELPRIVTETIEILRCTQKAKNSIEGVESWKK